MMKKIFFALIALIGLICNHAQAQNTCTINSLPWHETFDSLSTDGSYPACWQIIRSCNIASRKWPRIDLVDNMTCIGLRCSNWQWSMIGLPPITAPVQEVTLRFKARNLRTSGGTSKIIIGPGGSNNGSNYWLDTFAVINNPSNQWTEYEVFLPYSVFHNETITISWACNPIGTNAIIYMTDFRIEDDSICLSPFPGDITDITTEGATLNWTPRCNIATAYEVQMMNEDSVVVVDTLVADSLHSLTLDILNEHTHYLARMRTLCDTLSDNWVSLGDFTTLRHCHAATVSIEPLGNHLLFVHWTPSAIGDSATALEITYIDSTTQTSATFTSQISPFIVDGLIPGHTYSLIHRTLCGPWYEESDTITLTMDTADLCGLTPLPYFNDFNSLTPYSATSTDYDKIPPCWHNTYTGGDNEFQRLVTTDNNNICLKANTYSRNANIDAVSTPLLDIQGQTIRVVFDYKRIGRRKENICEVGVMINPYDRTTFVPIGQYSSPYSDQDWHEAEFFFTPEDDRPVALAFRQPGMYGSYYIDNILVETAANCRRPATVTVDEITDATAIAHWTPQGDYNNSYQIRYCIADGQYNYLYTSTADTVAYLSDLLPNSLYQVWVRNLCDTTMLRPWTSSNTFLTERACYSLINATIVQEGNDYIGIEWTFDESHHRQATDVQISWFMDSDSSSIQTMWVTANYHNAFIGPFMLDSIYTIELTTICDIDHAIPLTLHHTATSSSYRPLLMATPYDSTSILVYWHGNSSNYTLGYSTHADSLWQTFNVTTPPFLISGLDPSTVYDFSLYEIGAYDTAYSDTVSAATPCGTLHIPYLAVYDGTAPICWTMAVPNTYNWSPSPNFPLYRNAMAILPAMDMDASGLQLQLKYTGGNTHTLLVGIAESVTDTSTITWIHTINHPRGTVDTLLPLDLYTGTGRHLVLRSTGNSEFSIDRIHLDFLNLCPLVQTVRLDSLEATEAHLSWNPTASKYCVTLSHGSETDTLFTYDTVATFTNLLPTTDYTARVYTICDVGDTSLSSRPLTFRTPCDTYATLPLNENFNNVSSQLPECWTAVTDNFSYNTHWPCVASAGNTSLLVVRSSRNDSLGCIAATPMLPTSQIHVSFIATFWDTENAQVGLMTDLSDTSTFFPILSLPEENLSYSLYEISTDSLTLNDNSCYLVFRTRVGTFEIDDLQINALNYCRKPQYGSITNATTHSVSASWLSTNAEAYLVTCSDGATTDTLLVSDTTAVTFSGLYPATQYWISVSALCDGDTTEALSLGSIRTDCDLYPLPYFNDFESTANGYYPSCWESIDNTPNNYNGVNIDLDNYSNNAFYLLYCKAVSPRFVMPDSSLLISFRARSFFNDPDPDFEWSRGRLLCFTTRVVNDEPLLNSTDILRYDTLLSLTSWDAFSFICNEYQPGDTIAIVFWANSVPQNYRIDDFSVETFFDTTPVNPPVPDTVYRTLSLDVNDSTMGTVSGGGIYLDSSTVTISATPFEGYHFVKWNDNDTHTVRTITLVSDIAFTAYFAADTLPIPPDTIWRIVTLLCDSTMGSVSGDGTYPDSSLVTISATADSGYIFSLWSDGDTNAVRALFVTSDTTLWATFSPVIDTIWRNVSVNMVNSISNDTPTESDGVSVTGTGVYADSTLVTLTAIYNNDLWFWYWVNSVGDTIRDNPYSFIITSDTVFTAIFGPRFVGIGNVDGLPNVAIHPNPTTDDAYISVGVPSVVTVTDLQGRTVIQPTQVDSTLRIAQGTLPKGIYFVSVGNSAGTTVKKLVIQ